MSGVPYIRFFGDDWLSGTQSLTLEERGLLITIVAMTAAAGEAPVFDAKRLSRRLGCTRAKTEKLIKALCDEGKVRIEDGRLIQLRALKETKKSQENSEKQTKIARKRWEENGENSNKNNVDDNATALPRLCQPEPEPEPKLSTEDKSSVEGAYAHNQPNFPEQKIARPSKRGVARGSRMTASWVPSVVDYAFASNEGLTREEINREADKFRDYWIAASGRNAVKLDWSATWRNWIRSDYRKQAGSGERATKGAHRTQTGSQSGSSSMLAAGLRAVADIRGYGEQVPGERGMGTGYVIEGEAFGDD